ncbi:MAG: sodium:solute symporter family protein [Desulfovibrionaceae bacterium]|nr:sodium:solute symporter family protein [Desulfovibrionaceae bacterium]
MAFALLFLYALVIFWVGFVTARRTPDSFYVNNRESGAWSVGFSIFVSCVGASATIGVIGMAFAVGTPAFWWLGAGAAGLVLLSLALARKVRASGAYTLPHMVEAFLGPSVRPVISAVIVVAWVAILAAQFSALGRVLGSLTGFSPLPCLLIGLALVCGHTLGGQSAIMRTDRIQALLILSSLVIMLIWLTRHNPAWTGAVRLEAVNAAFPTDKLLYFLVIVGANYVVCPMLFGRMLSARDERSARIGGLIGAAGIALCAALIVAVGLACKGLIPAQTPQDEVLTSVLGTVMPYWMHLVVSFALISAIVSSADSCLVTAATVLSFDLLGTVSRPAIPSRSVRREQACVMLLGLAGAAVSLWGKSILGFLLMAYDVFACGVVMPVGIGLLLHGKRSIDPRFARVAVALGGLLGLTAALAGNPLWSYAGLVVSGVLTLGGRNRGYAA